MRVPTTPAHLFFLRKKIPASQKARVGTSTVSLARGANREVKERVKGKASRVQSTRIGSALVCVRRNVQHLELKLSKSTRFVLVTVVMVAVPTGCVVSPPPLFSQNMQSHEKTPTSHKAQGVPPTVSLALDANRKGKGRVVCVFVCILFPFILVVRCVWRTSRVTQGEGHTGFLIYLPSAVHSLIFLARRIQPSFSLVDRRVEFCVLTT